MNVDVEIIKTILGFIPDISTATTAIVVGLVIIAMMILARQKLPRMELLIVGICVVTAVWFSSGGVRVEAKPNDPPLISRPGLLNAASANSTVQKLRFDLRIQNPKYLQKYQMRLCLVMRGGSEVCQVVKQLQMGENRIDIYRDRLERASLIRMEVQARENAQLLSYLVMMPLRLFRRVS